MPHWEQSSYEPLLPVTEKSNPITRDIDRANPQEIVRMLQKCDAEIFGKTVHEDSLYQRLNSSNIIQTMEDISKRVQATLKDPEDSVIILSGCGTSGRLAFLLAVKKIDPNCDKVLQTSFNRWLAALHHKEIYSYIIAGGDRALLTSQEAPEDSPMLGSLMLDKACAGKKHVLFVGISCGLSAPFVAGQLQLCLNNLEKFTPVLVGFNPVQMARTEPMHDCPFHFREVAERMKDMQKQQKAFVLNPVVGPEAISGSSRMKAGSATKIMLETILTAAHEAVYSKTAITFNCIQASVKIKEDVHEMSYSQSEKLAAMLQAAGVSLREKGHVYYLGWQTLGIIGIIDASECIPTFGAGFEDIRGFIRGGFSELHNKEGDLSSMGPQFTIDHTDFVNTILPRLSDKDMVIFLFGVNDDLNQVAELAKSVGQNTSNLHAIAHEFDKVLLPDSIKDIFKSILNISWPSPGKKQSSTLMTQHWELSTKWCLNAISTGAHILKGKVYSNYMIDLKVTNSKLYRRAIQILQKFTSGTQAQCEAALLRAVYDVEDLTDEMRSADVIQHTLVANTKDRVVPTALVILQSGCMLAEAKLHLDAHPVIRDAVAACLRES